MLFSCSGLVLQSAAVWPLSCFKHCGVWLCVASYNLEQIWLLGCPMKRTWSPLLLIHFRVLKNWWPERCGVEVRVKSAVVSVSLCSGLNYNLCFIISSWCCQRKRRWEVSLLRTPKSPKVVYFTCTDLKRHWNQLHFLNSQNDMKSFLFQICTPPPPKLFSAI